MDGVTLAVCTVNLLAYEALFGEGPQVGHWLVDGARCGAVVAVVDAFTIRVAWQARRQRTKRARRLVHHVDTAKKHGLGWLLSQDTMDAVNAAYEGA